MEPNSGAPPADPEAMSAKSRYSIDILEVTLDLVELLARDVSNPQRASQLAHELGVTHNRVFRILKTLEARGYAEVVSPTDGYQLGPAFIPLAERVRGQSSVVQVAGPSLANLVDKTGDAAYLVMRAGARAVVVDRRMGRHPVQVTIGIGASIPLHLTAAGRLLLAWLPEATQREILEGSFSESVCKTGAVDAEYLLGRLREIRARGYELDEEGAVEAYAVAAPVRDHAGAAVAALAVTTPTARYSAARRVELVERVVDTARELSARLGYVDTGQ